MATAEQFRLAARKLRGAADSAASAEFRARTASYTVGVVGGDLEALVDRALMASQVMSGGLEAACLDAEAECLARAAVCDAYAVQYAQWQANHAHWEDLVHQASTSDGGVADPGPRPAAPQKQATWVDI